MANRMISYGYGVNDGRIVIIEKEADVVRQIFNDYCSGKILKDIAQELSDNQVEFYNGSCKWNKNIIARIIENRKYIGEKNYPAIVTLELFDRANAVKSEKGNKKIEQTAEIDHLKNIVFCATCGRKLRRISKWKTREKWVCQNGCKCERYIADAEIYRGIQSAVYEMRDAPDAFSVEEKGSTYKRTMEIARCNNELTVLMNERAPSFKVGKKIILTGAALRFKACEFCGAEYNSFIAEKINKLSDDIIPWDIIESIEIDGSGSVIVKFINGISVNDKIQGGEFVGSASKEDCNEDRSQSVAVETQ